MTEALTDCWGNPSSVYALGIDAAHRLRQARQAVAAALGAEPDRVFFTSGGTEADNWAIFSAAERLGKRGRHIITTAVEHHAVLHPMQKLEAKGFEVTYLQPDHDGNITVEELKKAPPPRYHSRLRHDGQQRDGRGHADCRHGQGHAPRFPAGAVPYRRRAGLLKVPFRAKGARRGHDLRLRAQNPCRKGHGRVIYRPGLPPPAFINGGGQESNYRSGTENMPGICGFGAACAGTDAKADIARMTHLRDLAGKAGPIDGLVLIGSQTAPHIVNLSLPGLRSQGIINCLQSDGIYVSAGSACSKGHRSHVLEAMHLSPAVIDGSIRVSFSRDNTEADVDALCQALLHAKQTLKG